MSTRDETTDALEEVWRGVVSVTAGLTDEEWRRPTGCPGWTVQDNVAHIAGLEAVLAGRPRPDHAPPDGLEHVRNDFGRIMEVDVDFRRGRPGEDVRDELREVTDLRLSQLRGMTDDEWNGDFESPFGVTPFARFIGIRLFDCLAHEQDIRRALGRPGNLDGTAGRLVAQRIVTALPRTLPKAVDRPVTVALDITGPHPAHVAVRIDGEHGSIADDAGNGEREEADVELRLDLALLVALVCGRADADAGTVEIAGDAELAAQVIAGLPMTP